MHTPDGHAVAKPTPAMWWLHLIFQSAKRKRDMLENNNECYVCADSTLPTKTNVCSCTGRWIHPHCQEKLLNTIETDGRCSVCRESYRNVKVTRKKVLNGRRLGLCLLRGSMLACELTAVGLMTVQLLIYWNILSTRGQSCSLRCDVAANCSVDTDPVDSNFKRLACLNVHAVLDFGVCTILSLLLLISVLSRSVRLQLQIIISHLPLHHDRREIHFVSDDVSDTPMPEPACIDGAYG